MYVGSVKTAVLLKCSINYMYIMLFDVTAILRYRDIPNLVWTG